MILAKMSIGHRAVNQKMPKMQKNAGAVRQGHTNG